MFLPTSKPNQKHHLKIPGSSSQLGPIKNLNITAYFASSCLLPPPIQYRSSPQRRNQTRKQKNFHIDFCAPFADIFRASLQRGPVLSVHEQTQEFCSFFVHPLLHCSRRVLRRGELIWGTW